MQHCSITYETAAVHVGQYNYTLNITLNVKQCINAHVKRYNTCE